MQKNNRTPNLIEALIPIIILIALLSLNVIIYKDSATYGPNQIALIVGAVIAALIGFKLGYTWEQIQKGMVKSINSAMSAILILLINGGRMG